VLQLRRLVIGEADRFPELSLTYWERGFERGLATVADGLRGLAERGLLRLDDAHVAAQHFAGLILWVPMNDVMFRGAAAQLARRGARAHRTQRRPSVPGRLRPARVSRCAPTVELTQARLAN